MDFIFIIPIVLAISGRRMIKAIIYSFKKSIRLKKISNILGIAAKLDYSKGIKHMAREDYEKNREREKKSQWKNY